MSMALSLSNREHETVRMKLTNACSQCGLITKTLVLRLDDDDNISGFDVYHHNVDLSFEVLTNLSKLFGTTDIHLSCERSCDDDGHSPYVTINRPPLHLVAP
jgi:hypothetical protein